MSSRSQGWRFFFKLYDQLLDMLSLFAALIILAIMVGVGLSVASRALNHPVGWIIEFTEYGLLFILLLGMPWLVRERGHVAIELLVNSVHVPAAMTMKVSATIIAGMNCLLISYWAFVATVDNYARNVETFGIYPIPRFILFAFVAGGFFLTAIEFFRWTIVTVVDRGKDRPGSDNGSVANPDLST